jgi:hypothetical protein
LHTDDKQLERLRVCLLERLGFASGVGPAARADRVLLPFAAWKNGPSAASYAPASVGVRQSPVSRLFIIGGLPIAVRVLIADAIRNGCGAVLLLSPITRLRGRGDTTRSRR